MNCNNLQCSIWSRADYVAAWKYIRAILPAVGATNVAWVWCPLATDFNATGGPAYYLAMTIDGCAPMSPRSDHALR
jgi:hypothetical protein